MQWGLANMACMSENSYSNNEGQAPHQVIKYTHAEMGPKIPAVLNINHQYQHIQTCWADSVYQSLEAWRLFNELKMWMMVLIIVELLPVLRNHGIGLVFCRGVFPKVFTHRWVCCFRWSWFMVCKQRLQAFPEWMLLIVILSSSFVRVFPRFQFQAPGDAFILQAFHKGVVVYFKLSKLGVLVGGDSHKFCLGENKSDNTGAI